MSAFITDAVPLGGVLLLSVRGLKQRPAVPGTVRVGGVTLRLLDVQRSPTLWLLGEATLVVERPAGEAWKGWRGLGVAAGDGA